MTKITKLEWKKRINSFLWRALMMLAALVVDFTLANLADFSFTPEATVVIGLLLGEISKVLNKKKLSFIEEK